MHFKAQDRTKLYYKDWGIGEAVILIHGWPLTSEMWEYQSRRLYEAGMRVITYDRRGFGRSDQPAGDYTYDTLASDLNDLINHLDLESVSLVGFSMGGGEVARYIANYGTDRISKVALVSSVVPFMLKTKDNENGVSDETFENIKEGLKEDRPAFLADFSKDFYGVTESNEAVSKEFLNWTFNMAMQASPIATISCVDSFGKTDFRKDLKKFDKPTLIVHGKEDKTVPIETSGKSALKILSSAVSKFYDGAPHGLFATHKDQLFDDLSNFLRGDKSLNISAKEKKTIVKQTR